MYGAPNERCDVFRVVGVFGERAQLRHDGIETDIRDRGDVLPKRRGQPGAVARFGIDEEHHPERAIAIKRVLGVRPHHNAAALTPSVVFAADGDASVERDDDLNRVVCVRRDDSLSSGGEEEAALPQVPARDAQPAIWLLVRGVRQARILPSGAGGSYPGSVRAVAADLVGW